MEVWSPHSFKEYSGGEEIVKGKIKKPNKTIRHNQWKQGKSNKVYNSKSEYFKNAKMALLELSTNMTEETH